MIIKKATLKRISDRPMPEDLGELLDELAQFASDGSVKIVYQSESVDDTDFYAIVRTSLADLAGDDEKAEIKPGGYDIELDGDLMGHVCETAVESAQETLRLCYQVGMLRLYGERGEHEYDIDDLSLEMDEWDFQTSRERLQEELAEV